MQIAVGRGQEKEGEMLQNGRETWGERWRWTEKMGRADGTRGDGWKALMQRT